MLHSNALELYVRVDGCLHCCFCSSPLLKSFTSRRIDLCKESGKLRTRCRRSEKERFALGRCHTFSSKRVQLKTKTRPGVGISTWQTSSLSLTSGIFERQPDEIGPNLAPTFQKKKKPKTKHWCCQSHFVPIKNKAVEIASALGSGSWGFRTSESTKKWSIDAVCPIGLLANPKL